MSFDWTEYLTLAAELASTANPPIAEAKLRSAVSRAYYAAFCKAKSHCISRNECTVPTDGAAHLVIALHFRRGQGNSSRVRRKIGENLARLRRDRNCADYDDTVPNLPQVAKKALVMARMTTADLAML